MMSSTTTTKWAKITKNLCINVIAGYSSGKFKCPVFGTTHIIDRETVMNGRASYRKFDYRGYTYYIRRMYHCTHEGWYFCLGLIQSSIMKPIMLISDDLTHTIHYDTSGKMVEQKWMKM